MDPSDKFHINITEEVEIQTTIDNRAAQFKIKATELSGLFDLGKIQVGDHWLNPYVGVKMPRSGTHIKSNNTTTFGALFHLAKGSHSRYRIQAECILRGGPNPQKDNPEIELRSNASFAYKNFVFSGLKSIDLSGEAKVNSKISAAGVIDNASGYAQLDLAHFTPSLFTLGLGYKLSKNLGLYGEATQSLKKDEK